MLQLLYVSTSAGQITPSLLEDICDQSRVNNSRDEVTGFLLTRKNRFLQALEGPRTTVEDTFLRIIVDPRHQAVRLLLRQMITRRQFGDWDMRRCDSLEECRDYIATIEDILEDGPDASRQAFADFMAHDQSDLDQA